MPSNDKKPLKTLDTPAMRVALHARVKPVVELLTLEFLLDPRLQVYDVGALTIGAVDKGKLLDVKPGNLRWPGDTTGYLGVRRGMQSICQDVQLLTDPKPVTIDVLRGTLTAVVAISSKREEWNIVNGDVVDQTPHRVGEWTITALPGHDLNISGRGSGPQRPDREFVLKVERMSEKAPPFPAQKKAIVHFEGSPGGPPEGVNEPTAKGALVQEWPVRLVTKNAKNPATKVIMDVPTEVQMVVLPFEFKEIVTGNKPKE